MRPDAAMRDGKMDKLVKLDQYLIWLVDQAQTMTTWSNLSVILCYTKRVLTADWNIRC